LPVVTITPAARRLDLALAVVARPRLATPLQVTRLCKMAATVWRQLLLGRVLLVLVVVVVVLGLVAAAFLVLAVSAVAVKVETVVSRQRQARLTLVVAVVVVPVRQAKPVALVS
jgi:hypothetical protein